jgi:hypothetical protein
MTNAESKLASAIENRDSGKLNQWESDFVTQFEDYNKKDLRNLTSKQYKKLRDIANK